MKRIQSACLSQTIHFIQKDPMSKELATEANRVEYERDKKQMQRSYTKFKIIREEILEDGTLEIQLKKQYNSYEVGSYFD